MIELAQSLLRILTKFLIRQSYLNEPIMLIEDETRLKTWISQVVEDISDAEPDALAKYVIALVKKPLSDADLEKLCSDKLSVFLQSHTEVFVSRLFQTLKSGQYLSKNTASALQEPAKLAIQQRAKVVEEKAAAEHDELVLTDGESDHEQEREEAVQQPKTTKGEAVQQQHYAAAAAKAVSVMSSPRAASAKEQMPQSSSSRRSTAAAEQRPKVRAASPTVALSVAQPSTTTKPPRKRISPPPRSASAERRAADRRASPLPPPRRRVVVTGGSGGGSMRISSSNRLMVVERERERHHRGGGGGRGGIGGRSRSKSRSPHRKEKRLGVELEPRISSSRRHRCRDFHEKGFCMRGDNCPFDHGPDPVVVENSALKDIVRDTTIFDSPTTYGVNPPPPGLENTMTANAVGVNKLLGSVTEGYNPEAPSMDASSAVQRIDFSLLYPPVPAPTAAGILQPLAATASDVAGGGGVLPLRPAVVADSSLGGGTLRGPLPSTISVSANAPQSQDNSGRMAMRGGRFKPYTMGVRNPTTRSLLVKKIPPELNKIAQIDQHFSRFGQVTNIQVQYEGRTDSALVTFKTRRDAMIAYKSTEPIFNNRFVKLLEASLVKMHPGISNEPIQYPRYFTKVFAHQKKEDEEESAEKESPTIPEMASEGQNLPDLGTAGYPPSVAEIAALQHPSRPPYNSKLAAMKKRTAADHERLNKLAEVQRMKTELYTKLVEQQKNLLKKLQQTEDKEAKKKIVKYLKTFELKVKGIKAELEQLALKLREMQMRQPQSKRTRSGHSASEQHQSAEDGVEANAEHIGGTVQQSPSKYSMPNKKLLKLCRVVYVSACPPELNEKLILHMEKFGELFDYDINAVPQIFTYKEPLDAQKAVNEAAGCFELTKLKVEWAPVAKGVKSNKDIVPDGERKPSDQVAAKDLLALLEYDEEEEENYEKKEEDDEQSDDKAGILLFLDSFGVIDQNIEAFLNTVQHSLWLFHYMEQLELERGAFSEGTIACCDCGTPIAPNPANMCLGCVRSRADITEEIPKQSQLHSCRNCERFFVPPNAWSAAKAESKELMALCLARLKPAMTKVRLVDAAFVWTEPHSKRVKVKLTIQKEVFSRAVLQQSLVVEFVLLNQMCDDCRRFEAKDYWRACVQVRQRCDYKKTLFYLEQLLIKHNAQAQASGIKPVPTGIDFFFARQQEARKLVDFISSALPSKFHQSQQLVTHDVRNNFYDYKHTYCVDIVPITKDALICLPKSVAQCFANIGQFVVCLRVTDVVSLINPRTLQLYEVNATAYWKNAFDILVHPKSLIEFFVVDVEEVDDPFALLPHGHGNVSTKHRLADVWVVRSDQVGHSESKSICCRSHLGHLLVPGDTVLGYNVWQSNLNNKTFDEVKEENVPDVVLIRKSYDRSRRIRRRQWRLKRLLDQEETASVEREFNEFMDDVEEDPALRERINIYRKGGGTVGSKRHQPTTASRTTKQRMAPPSLSVCSTTADEEEQIEGAPTLAEMLEDLELNDVEMREEEEQQP
uniref:60S ribosomal export protein NMD3 n=1 Tax=Globodera rostochiensis TaxID=31243 RepID=A0A914I4D3_GLORO